MRFGWSQSDCAWPHESADVNGSKMHQGQIVIPLSKPLLEVVRDVTTLNTRVNRYVFNPHAKTMWAECIYPKRTTWPHVTLQLLGRTIVALSSHLTLPGCLPSFVMYCADIKSGGPVSSSSTSLFFLTDTYFIFMPILSLKIQIRLWCAAYVEKYGFSLLIVDNRWGRCPFGLSDLIVTWTLETHNTICKCNQVKSSQDTRCILMQGVKWFTWDWLATCPGCTPSLTQCQLRSATACTDNRET